MSALRTGRPLPPGSFLVLIYVRGWVELWAIVRLDILRELRNPTTSSGMKPATFRLILRTNYLHRTHSFLRSRQSFSHSRISKHFVESEGLLSCSQELSMVPILSETSRVHITQSCLSKINFNVILPTARTLNVPRGLFRCVFFSEILQSFLFFTMRATCSPLLDYSIIFSEKNKLWSS
jgi:hypothetical protein